VFVPQVLVLEYAPGKKINDGPGIDAMGLDRKRLARLVVESYLQQLLRHGLFHADPHPGEHRCQVLAVVVVVVVVVV
jgi:predicted unusual protein kinase regulating ubiquinone biosynthesis (AarF/ABC1/UbiB family)